MKKTTMKKSISDLYNFYWVFCFINFLNWNLHIKKAWEAQFKVIEKSDMEDMIRKWKNINRLYKPLPVLLYTDWKHWKIENFDCYKATTESIVNEYYFS